MVMLMVMVTVMAYGPPKPFGTRKGATRNANAICAHDTTKATESLFDFGV